MYSVDLLNNLVATFFGPADGAAAADQVKQIKISICKNFSSLSFTFPTLFSLIFRNIWHHVVGNKPVFTSTLLSNSPLLRLIFRQHQLPTQDKTFPLLRTGRESKATDLFFLSPLPPTNGPPPFSYRLRRLPPPTTSPPPKILPGKREILISPSSSDVRQGGGGNGRGRASFLGAALISIQGGIRQTCVAYLIASCFGSNFG